MSLVFQLPTIQIYDLTKAQLPISRVSSSSSMSDDSENEEHVIPYTLSPLDECRGAFSRVYDNYAFSLVGNVVATTHKKRKTYKKQGNNKAQGKKM